MSNFFSEKRHALSVKAVAVLVGEGFGLRCHFRRQNRLSVMGVRLAPSFEYSIIYIWRYKERL